MPMVRGNIQRPQPNIETWEEILKYNKYMGEEEQWQYTNGEIKYQEAISRSTSQETPVKQHAQGKCAHRKNEKTMKKRASSCEQTTEAKQNNKKQETQNKQKRHNKSKKNHHKTQAGKQQKQYHRKS